MKERKKKCKTFVFFYREMHRPDYTVITGSIHHDAHKQESLRPGKIERRRTSKEMGWGLHWTQRAWWNLSDQWTTCFASIFVHQMMLYTFKDPANSFAFGSGLDREPPAAFVSQSCSPDLCLPWEFSQWHENDFLTPVGFFASQFSLATLVLPVPVFSNIMKAVAAWWKPWDFVCAFV